MASRSRSAIILRSLTLPHPEFVDAPRLSLPTSNKPPDRTRTRRGLAARGRYAERDDCSLCKAELLGGERLHADGGSVNMALWWKHTLPGADCAGRHAIHSGLRHGSAHAGEPRGLAERGNFRGDAYFCYALPLGPHSGHSVFCSA